MIYRHRVAVFLCTITCLLVHQLELKPADVVRFIPSLGFVVDAWQQVLEQKALVWAYNVVRCLATLDGYGLAALIYEALLTVFSVITGADEQQLYEEEATNLSVCVVSEGLSYDAKQEEVSVDLNIQERSWVLSWMRYFDEEVMPYISEQLNKLSYLHIVTFLALVATPWIKPVRTLKEKDLITHY